MRSMTFWNGSSLGFLKISELWDCLVREGGFETRIFGLRIIVVYSCDLLKLWARLCFEIYESADILVLKR